MSNLSDLLKDIGDKDASLTSEIGNVIGTVADISGVIGLAQVISTLFNSSYPSLQDLVNLVQTDYNKIEAINNADQIVNRNTILNTDNGLAWGTFQGLPSEIAAHPSAAEIVAFLQPLRTALDDLSGPAQPDLVWNVNAGSPIYWTDAGQYQGACFNGYTGLEDFNYADVSYGLQAPPLNADNETVFYYGFSLQLYLFTVAMLVTSGTALDPNFSVDNADILRTSAGVLENKHDKIVQTGMVSLSPPNWVQSGLTGAVCSTGWPQAASGIRLSFETVTFQEELKQVASGATIEYGVVERYSGYSSVGDAYEIAINYQGAYEGENPDSTVGDTALYGKFLLRLMKRYKDVYIGVGLASVWKTMNSLRGMVGDPLLPRPCIADWSFRQAFGVSELAPIQGAFSLRALAQLIVTTQPFDTPYTNSWPHEQVSFRQLLNGFPD